MSKPDEIVLTPGRGGVWAMARDKRPSRLLSALGAVGHAVYFYFAGAFLILGCWDFLEIAIGLPSMTALYIAGPVGFVMALPLLWRRK